MVDRPLVGHVCGWGVKTISVEGTNLREEGEEIFRRYHPVLCKTAETRASASDGAGSGRSTSHIASQKAPSGSTIIVWNDVV
jgi:hypothetical protein